MWIEDGEDYFSLWRDYCSGNLAGKTLSEHLNREKTERLEKDGHFFIIKHAVNQGKISLLKRIFGGPIYRRRFLLTWKAIDSGCDIVPRPYLLAEKPAGFRRVSESYLILEYLEGEVLAAPEGQVPEIWIRGLEDCLAALHRYGIASGNAHPWNLVRTGNGMKIIDISFKFPMLVSQANDIIDSGRKFGTQVSVQGGKLKLTLALMRFKRSWIKFRKNRKR